MRMFLFVSALTLLTLVPALPAVAHGGGLSAEDTTTIASTAATTATEEEMLSARDPRSEQCLQAAELPLRIAASRWCAGARGRPRL